MGKILLPNFSKEDNPESKEVRSHFRMGQSYLNWPTYLSNIIQISQKVFVLCSIQEVDVNCELMHQWMNEQTGEKLDTAKAGVTKRKQFILKSKPFLLYKSFIDTGGKKHSDKVN